MLGGPEKNGKKEKEKKPRSLKVACVGRAYYIHTYTFRYFEANIQGR